MDHAALEFRLQKAEELIRAGEDHISRQQEIIEVIIQDGHDELLASAKKILSRFEELQGMNVAERDRLRRELDQARNSNEPRLV